jgi:hypothetical protein
MSMMHDRDTAITRDPAQGPAHGPAQGGVQQTPGQGYAPQYGYGYRPMYGRRMNMFTETRPSFMTSEFIFTILGVIGIAITAATAADIDSRLSTMLITGLLAAYVVSRGIAKAGSRSSADDPRDNVHLGDGNRH